MKSSDSASLQSECEFAASTVLTKRAVVPVAYGNASSNFEVSIR